MYIYIYISPALKAGAIPSHRATGGRGLLPVLLPVVVRGRCQRGRRAPGLRLKRRAAGRTAGGPGVIWSIQYGKP